MPNVQTIDTDIKKLDRMADRVTAAAVTMTMLGVWGIVWVSAAPGNQWVWSILTGLAFLVGIRLTIRAAVLKSGVALATALNERSEPLTHRRGPDA